MISTASLALLAVLGCNNSTLHAVGDGTHPDRRGCCLPDPTMSSCMDLGGYSPQGCGSTCDFFCSTNWRIEDDSHGCPTWRWDLRASRPGEDLLCFPRPDAGGGVLDGGNDAADAGSDAADAGSDAGA